MWGRRTRTQYVTSGYFSAVNAKDLPGVAATNSPPAWALLQCRLPRLRRRSDRLECGLYVIVRIGSVAGQRDTPAIQIFPRNVERIEQRFVTSRQAARCQMLDRLVAIRVPRGRHFVNHGIIEPGVREPRLKCKKAEDELHETPLAMLDLRFGDEDFVGCAVRRARKRPSQRDQTHSNRRRLGRIRR